MNTLKNLIGKYIAPALAAGLGWLASVGVPMPEDTDQTILTALAVIIAAVVFPVIAWAKDKVTAIIGGVFKKSA